MGGITHRCPAVEDKSRKEDIQAVKAQSRSVRSISENPEMAHDVNDEQEVLRERARV